MDNDKPTEEQNSSTEEENSTTRCPSEGRPVVVPNRSELADRKRKAASFITHLDDKVERPADNRSNGEEGTYPNYPYQANYSKGLPHVNERGDVDPAAYERYRNILDTGRTNGIAPFEDIPLSPMAKRKLVNPQSGIAFDLEGPDAFAVNTNIFRNPARPMRPAPRIDGRENSAEMVELYWMALLRDLNFTEYQGNGDAQAAARDLDGVKNYFDRSAPYPTGAGGRVTEANIFRGSAPGDNAGPYISQFLYKGNSDPALGITPDDGLISYGTLKISQRQRTVKPGSDFMTDPGSWLLVQNGTGPGGMDPTGSDDFENRPAADGNPLRFIRNMRDLANWVHFDQLYQHFFNAALIMLSEMSGGGPRSLDSTRTSMDGRAMMAFPFDPGNPYAPPNPDSRNQEGFGTFGGPHVLVLLAEVATRALKAVWFQKWYVHRRLRPEEFGGRVHFQKEAMNGGGAGPYPCIDRLILNAPVLDRVRDRFGTYLLPQVFPEGSPIHTSYGSGHATVAGACTTILKAFFAERRMDGRPILLKDVLGAPVVSNDDGSRLERYTGDDADRLTVEGELNKLASNISIGRNGAGVHWRSDAIESMRLGEAVAAGLLLEQAITYSEGHSFTFNTFFTNERVVITKGRGNTLNRVRWQMIRPAREDEPSAGEAGEESEEVGPIEE